MILKASKLQWSVVCVDPREEGWEVGAGEEAAKIRNQRLSVTLQSEKKMWRNQEHAEERSERAIIMQYAHCRQTGGTGPSSFLTSDSKKAFVVAWSVRQRCRLG